MSQHGNYVEYLKEPIATPMDENMIILFDSIGKSHTFTMDFLSKEGDYIKLHVKKGQIIDFEVPGLNPMKI